MDCEPPLNIRNSCRISNTNCAILAEFLPVIINKVFLSGITRISVAVNAMALQTGILHQADFSMKYYIEYIYPKISGSMSANHYIILIVLYAGSPSL